MIDKPIKFGSKAWHAYIKQKYAGKSIQAGVAHNERVKLEEKYGEKIILGKLEDMVTDEEKMDKVEYEALGSVLNEISPDYKKAHDLFKSAYKTQRLYKLLFASGKKIALVILGTLLMLALLKYLLT